ncbi:MAG: sarcosine oxidase subunit gamma family protein [Pseudomonadales bacterium]|nr:sarcosine oxidase subunit gamma family protein [Pseudomonadales bacterium]NRA16874.1 sarcosine oxidase subunit gamma family protein [Oceanospirillaceae bacterium]
MSDSENNQAFNYAASVDCIEQRPATERQITGQSPLHHADLGTVAQAQLGQTGTVQLTELKLLGHLILRGRLDNVGFTSGVKLTLGLELPGTLQMVVDGDISIRWISPDEWLVVVPGERSYEIEQALVNNVQGHCAVINASGGQTILRLQGEDVQKVLQKSVPLDVHPRSFPIGKVVTTVFAKTQAVISRTGDQQWELVIRRSFSDYVWLWLQDCSAEFKLVITEQ